MIEDDIYRSSTQYRCWSYTPQALAALRAKTNAVAANRVRTAIKRAREEKSAANGTGNGSVTGEQTDISCLTVEEELKIVQWGCSKIVDMGAAMEPPVPFEIRATAIQFLRRFYLTNSPMTYHPKQIMMCALFLATKTDHYHIGLQKFISKLPKTTEDDIKAPEFLLMQGLRFTLDVKHPTKGLDGGVMEMRAMAEGPLATAFANFMSEQPSDESRPQRRIDALEYRARESLKGAAQMTDAYFLFTPSQIWLGASLNADDALTRFYLDSKFQEVGIPLEGIRSKIVATIEACAGLLASYTSEEEDPEAKREMKKIGKKLHLCQNPEKLDLVEISRAQKRETAEDGEAEKALKKRKMEREKLERDGDIFGSSLRAG